MTDPGKVVCAPGGRLPGTGFQPALPVRDGPPPMSWQVAYCLDFGFCHRYPRDYWPGYFETLRQYGYNVVWLWVGGALPAPGFEATLEWRCEYVPEIVDSLHDLGMRVHLMTGVFGWPGSSPGLLRMRPDIEIDWPEDLRGKYPMDSTRRGICPTRGFDISLAYVEALYRACPRADGMSLEVFCEKPHCRCDACASQGLWRIELAFLEQAVRRLRAVHPHAEVVWNIGYERTHGTNPESRLYEEIRKIDAPGLVWWHTRLDQGYTDRAGVRHAWSDPAELAAFGRNTLCLPRRAEHFRVARRARALGVATVGPSIRNLFLPEADPRHFGYRVEGPPPDRALHDHVLFHTWALRSACWAQDPEMDQARFRPVVARHFFAGEPEADLLADRLLLLEDLVVVKRVCMGRARARVWGDLDGGESAASGVWTEDCRAVLRRMAGAVSSNRWVADMRASAEALLGDDI